MLSQGKELSAVNFEAIIGGPLIAVVRAQGASANETVNFLRAIAFEDGQDGDPNKMKMVEFDFTNILGKRSSAGDFDTTGGDFTIQVPLITIVPIPFLRVESMTIDFNINLHSVQTSKVDNTFDFENKSTVKEDSWWSPVTVDMTTSVTERNTYQNSTTVDDTYSLQISVHAVQDRLPAGLNEVLNIFTNVVQQQAAAVSQVITASVQSQTDSLPKPKTTESSDNSTTNTNA